jgi:phospholipid transport system substrate-binding protein
MSTRFRGAIGVLIAVSVAGPAAFGGEIGAVSPEAITRSACDRVLGILRDPALQGGQHRDERRKKLRAIADEVFDWEDMARRSLGTHWRKATLTQRTRFVHAFKEILADRYLNDIDGAQGNETYRIDRSVKTGDVILVDTTLITHSREPIAVSYTFHRVESGWRAHDVSIENVDLVEHYRTVFHRLLVNSSLDKLLITLEEKRAGIG